MAENIVVTKDARKYKTIITDIGNEKIALAALEGKKVDIVTAVVTDGGGQYFVPTGDMTKLDNEVWRGPIANKETNALSPNMIDVRIFLDGSVGGFTARGIGLLDSEGDLIAVCNMPDTAKVMIIDGVAATLTLIMHIVVTNVDVLDFKIDPNVDTVTSEEMEAAIKRNTGEIMARVNDMVAGAGAAVSIDLTIPTSGWVQEGSEKYPYLLNLPMEDVTEEMIPSLTVLEEGEAVARSCGFAPWVQTLDGMVRFFSASVPTAEIPACLTLQKNAAELTPGNGVGLQPGAGLVLDENGNLALDTASPKEVTKLFDGSNG